MQYFGLKLKVLVVALRTTKEPSEPFYQEPDLELG